MPETEEMRFARLIASAQKEREDPSLMKPIKKSVIHSNDPTARFLGVKGQNLKGGNRTNKKKKVVKRALDHVDRTEMRAAKNQIRRLQKKARKDRAY